MVLIIFAKKQNMINYKIIPFNSFQVNTVILWDETKDCVIVDAGCFDSQEEQQLVDFIENNSLKPQILLNTHYHIDHVLGNKFCQKKWGISPTSHKDSSIFVDNVWSYSSMFGINPDDIISPAHFLEDGDKVNFGNSTLEVLYTPGHADGSLCFYNSEAKLILAGDLLFQGSIGRTDLPTGNLDVLKKSVFEKLFVLPDDTEVICGHGPNTTLGIEKKSNPFLY